MRNNTNSHTKSRTAVEPVDALMNDVAAIKRDLGNLLAQRVEAVSDRTREVMDHTVESAKAVRDRVGETASARPFTTMLVAAAAGAVGIKVLGWMFRR